MKDLKQLIMEGNLRKVKSLLKKGADVHVDHDWALRYATANGHKAIVKLLLEYGADVKTNPQELATS
jgi:ankyrin repeat protein